MSTCPACGSTNTVFLSRRNGAAPGPLAAAGAGSAALGSPKVAPSPVFGLSLYRPDPLTIFLSYGHDGFTNVSRHLKATLESRGHRVWFDEDSLVVGRAWADMMAEGLESVEQAGAQGRVVFMFAQWGVRRGETAVGFCMNELSKGLQNPRIKNNPGVAKCLHVVKLQDADAPASIHGRPMFDMSDVMPAGVDPSVWKPPPEPCGGMSMADWDAHFESPAFKARLWKLVEVLETDCMERFIDPEHIVVVEDTRGLSTPTSAGLSTPVPTTPTASTTCRVYISCEPKYVALASKLAEDLDRAGFGVWFKPESLDPAHPDYDASLRADFVEQGLQWASTKGSPSDGMGKCIALLTPGAVQRSSGFCADELLKAFTKGLFFVPLMVRRCEAPLHMCSIQWLEFKATVTDGGVITEHYAAALPKLKQALRGAQLDMEGKQARLIAALMPLDFETDVATHVENFEGREWAVSLVDSWLADASAGRVLWLTGKMGLGKTALASYLSAQRSSVLAYHLANPADDVKCDARRAVLSLAYQLSTQLESVWDSLFKHKLLEDSIQVKTAEALFEMLISKPLGEVPDPPQPAALLVDGLDAMTNAGRNEFARILALAIRPEGMVLPPWLRVIVFSRDDPVVNAALSTTGATPTDLTLRVDELNADLRQYLHKSLLPFTKTPAGAGETPADVSAAADTVVTKADGLFLYCRQIVQALEQGQAGLDDMDTLPVGIDGMLHDAMQRMFSDVDSYARLCRPAMEVVVAVEEPIDVSTLGEVLGWEAYQRQEVSAVMRSLFTFHKGFLQPFHSALLDWVADPRRAGLFLADTTHGHKFLADWAWSRIRHESTIVGGDLSSLPKYVLRHAMTHMSSVRHPNLGDVHANDKFQTAARVLTIQANGMNSFFHGTINRVASEALLAGKPVGTFLIRYSTTAKTYCVSFLDPLNPGKPRHNLLYLLTLGGGVTGYSELDPKRFVPGVNTLYDSLGSFVEAYQVKGRLKDSVPCATPAAAP